MPHRFPASLGVAALAGFMVIGLGHASALESCTGTYSAALLHPLANPAVVTLELQFNSDRNTSLAKSFTNGMREAGVAVAGAPTVKLTLSYQVIGQGGGNTSSGALTPGGGGQSGASNWWLSAPTLSHPASRCSRRFW